MMRLPLTFMRRDTRPLSRFCISLTMRTATPSVAANKTPSERVAKTRSVIDEITCPVVVSACGRSRPTNPHTDIR